MSQLRSGVCAKEIRIVGCYRPFVVLYWTCSHVGESKRASWIVRFFLYPEGTRACLVLEPEPPIPRARNASQRAHLPRARSNQQYLRSKQPIRSSKIAHPSAVGHELVSLSNRRPALNSAPLPQSRRAPTQSRSHLEHTKIVVFAVPTRHMLVASPAAPAPTS